jgi:hypothetical protein
MVEVKTKVVTTRAILIGAFMSAFFAYFTVVTVHREPQVEVTATQIPVFPYLMLFLTVLMINPFLRLIRLIRPLTVAEILLIFTMGVVSSGLSTIGLVDQLIPISSSLYYKDWNTDQAQWNRYIEPYVNEAYFLSEPGIQDAAILYEKEISLRDNLKAVHLKAVTLESKEQALKKALDAAGAAGAAGADDTRVKALSAQAGEARKEWLAAREKFAAPDIAEVIKTYPDILAAQEKIAAEKKAALRKLEQKAFEKVEPFRRGLPKDQQAYPGFMFLPGDDSSTYFGRLKRLVDGRAALANLESVEKNIKSLSDTDALPDSAVQQAVPLLQAAAEKLEPLANVELVRQAGDSVDQRQISLTRELGGIDAELSRLNDEKHWAPAAELAAADAQITDASSRKAALEREKKELAARVLGVNRQKEISSRITAVIGELQALQARLQSAPGSAAELRAALADISAKFPSFDASYRRYFFGDVPWCHWGSLLLRWGALIFLTYLILMTFNVLIFRQWAHNEKLIYPLAELSEILAGHNDEKPGMFPQIFRSGLFWLGVAVSGSILGWNLLALSKALPGLQPLDLTNFWQPYIQNSPLKGLLPSAKSAIFFTMIGLSFLAPAKVSFSLWFFWVVMMVQLLVLVWLGCGDNESSFPKEWYYTMNFCTAQGGGAMLVFAGAVMYKCRRYLLCAFSPQSVRELEPDERRELRVSSALFLAGSALLILMLWLSMGSSLWHTLFCYGIVMMLTIGLVRGVAEGGLLGFQAWAGPFHFIRNIAGFDKAWSAPPLFTPLMLYYSVFFLDIKTFIAPAMANSLKVRDDLRMERGRYHLAMFACIALAIVTAIAVSLMMAYADGANTMNNGFYNWLPRNFIPQLKAVTQNPPAASPEISGWIVAGALAMLVLLHFRQSLFWLPHPIGMIMLVNPIMWTFWFPIFLGWLAKHLVTKYGNRDTYAQTRALFIGLIAGELFIIMLALYFSHLLNVKIPIDMNRNA